MKKSAIVLLLILLGVFSGNAQTFSSNNGDDVLESFNQRNSINLLSSQQRQSQNNSNLVFIDQVGDNNQATVNVRAGVTDLNLLQQGDDNDIYLNVTAQQVRETVVQLGDNNNFTDFSQNTKVHNLELIQQGDNQNLIWYGGNSISDDLKIRMEGNIGQSVIVRNFN